MAGGRPSGSTNHRSMEFRIRLDEICKRLKFDLIESTVMLAKESEEESIRIQATRILTDHGYPKLKALEVYGADGGPLVVTLSKADGDL